MRGSVRMPGKHEKHKGKQQPEYSWGFKKPDDYNLTLKQKIKYTIYDSRQGTPKIFGRTPKNWGKLGLWYLAFHTVGAILFGLCMKGLLMTIDEHMPRYILEDSLIGNNPGMGFRPMPQGSEDGSSVVWYQAKNKTNIDLWMKSFSDFLAPYMEEPGRHKNRAECDYKLPKQPDKVCDCDVQGPEWGECTLKNNYGFPSSSPCIFLKLNRIIGWVPDYYRNESELPSNMPEFLKNEFKKTYNTDQRMLNTIWVSCSPEGPADNETLGPIQYFPRPGFPGYYYPYMNQPGYLSPLIAVQFKRPPVARLVNIECRAWARNIIYQRQTGAKDRMGSVHFEILVDP